MKKKQLEKVAYTVESIEKSDSLKITFYLFADKIYCSEQYNNISKFSGEDRIIEIIEDVENKVKENDYSYFEYYNLTENGYEKIKKFYANKEIKITIKEAREKANLSRKELCSWLGIPYNTLIGWENGSRNPSPYEIKLIVEEIENRDKKNVLKPANDLEIREAREKVGLTQKELSAWLGIPLITLSSWETGIRDISNWKQRLIVRKIVSIL